MTLLGGNIERSSWLSSYLLSQSLVWAMRKGRIQKYPGVSDLLASLGHTGRRVALGHTLNTQTLMKTDELKNRLLVNYDFVLGNIHSHPGLRVGHPCPVELTGHFREPSFKR